MGSKYLPQLPDFLTNTQNNTTIFESPFFFSTPNAVSLVQKLNFVAEKMQQKAAAMAMDGGVRSNVKVIESARRRVKWPFDGVVRFLGLVFTLVAAVVVGVDNESKIISVTLIKSMPPLHFYASAKWQYMSAFKYFVVSNCIACAYAAVSLVYSVVTRGYENNPSRSLLLITLDLIMVGLLSSADGAAAAIGVIGRAGNSHMHWIKVCGFFEGYCHHFTAALVISIAGSVMFLCLVVVSIVNLHKN